jgi:hypothetical protein
MFYNHKTRGGVVDLGWTSLAATAVRGRWMELRPSSGDDADGCSAWVPSLPLVPALSSRLS